MKSDFGIKSVWFDIDLDLIVLLLNNKKILKRPISDFPRLRQATVAELQDFSTDGIGIRWEKLDEDLSLRGFLKNELAQMTPTLFQGT